MPSLAFFKNTLGEVDYEIDKGTTDDRNLTLLDLDGLARLPIILGASKRTFEDTGSGMQLADWMVAKLCKNESGYKLVKHTGRGAVPEEIDFFPNLQSAVEALIDHANIIVTTPDDVQRLKANEMVTYELPSRLIDAQGAFENAGISLRTRFKYSGQLEFLQLT